MKRKLNIKITVLLICILIVIITFSFSLSKYLSKNNSSITNISIAKPIIEIENDITETNIVNGESVVKYFTVSNYNTDESTDIAMDYYLYAVNEENNLIDNITIYYQTEANNPNEYTLAPKINDGIYTGYFKAKEFTTKKEKHEYKLVVDSVNDYTKIYVKVLAVQKDVNS